ncbi:DNA/RNA non-specific endonuclease [Flaviaesturariibacter aridisoli]|uniref:DNA/RNA non-specific endonuclease n=1 Tax=Flaviaesturariibacter aridisoli TaxID=2545761 RepID=A0A4V2WMP7_9BACT|nr:DNA/RNA non-specific endonuclease [Flaviaesturariibacter aridisoli]TCZ71777.1 DNA/RNA non-specific endonuclease [Flaviaesturariibacter aridisoli]
MSRPAPARSVNGLLLLMILLVLVLVAVLFVCRQRQQRSGPPPVAVTGLEIPARRNSDTPVPHEGYALGYRSDARQAAWVAYLLTAQEVAAAHEPRTNNFRPDPAVPGGTADNSDYEGSGYDRGHLASAEDLSYSRRSMSQSFYYSNMSPQVPAFNRGVWRRLEELVRFWATAYDSIYIVSGPVLEPGLPVIGPHHVAVPRYYYKAVLRYGHNGTEGIAFLLRNEPSAATLKSFAVPIDSVESVTGLDLFPQLPDETEIRVEGKVREKEWRWTRKNPKDF